MSSAKKRNRREHEEEDAGSWEWSVQFILGSKKGVNYEYYFSTVCTYRNRFESFKCEMCDTRKGTSTRKPRLNQNVVQQQTIVQNFVVQQATSEKAEKPIMTTATRRNKSSSRMNNGDSPGHSRLTVSPDGSSIESSRAESRSPMSVSSPPSSVSTPSSRHLQHRTDDDNQSTAIDRSSARTLAITVKGVTVYVTDYRPMVVQRQNGTAS